MPTKPPKRRGLTPGIALLLAAAAVIAYMAAKKSGPFVAGSGCQAGTGAAAISLDSEQAAIAATIAGVAHQQAMPARAVVIAYAAAMQESKMHNLSYGDRDSVGVFQQRPSEGWGPARDLKNPVYASTKFFQALAKVPDYQRKPVYRAAQAVQHSADGYAYVQYEPEATALATAFTGHSAHAVWCWPSGSDPPAANLTAARRALAETFGPVGSHRTATPGDAPTMVVRAPRAALGWAVATWLVTHASSYGIHDIRYDGLVWRAASGGRGWTRDKSPAHPGQVLAS
ncbi:MAG TPA: hypothetical protein VMV17_22450 [Streptosporangiaceae bacterium]|nr:hypothetical protein [Streptosporangiaceae bacterium]